VPVVRRGGKEEGGGVVRRKEEGTVCEEGVGRGVATLAWSLADLQVVSG
jgi:hypothetical protein